MRKRRDAHAKRASNAVCAAVFEAGRPREAGVQRRCVAVIRAYPPRMPAGRVSEVWRWAVKSMGGERLRATRVDFRGVGGDRTHVVEAEHKGAWRPLTE